MKGIKEIIKEKGLKATPQRIAVYMAMSELGHASADAIVESLSTTFPTLTVATVYNILESFVDSGLLMRRYSSNSKMYFDINTHEHVHIYDKKTNTFTDLEEPELVKLVSNYLTNKGLANNYLGFDLQLIK